MVCIGITGTLHGLQRGLYQCSICERFIVANVIDEPVICICEKVSEQRDKLVKKFSKDIVKYTKRDHHHEPVRCADDFLIKYI